MNSIQSDKRVNKSCIYSLGAMSKDNVKKGREQKNFNLRFVPDKDENQMLNQLFPL